MAKRAYVPGEPQTSDGESNESAARTLIEHAYGLMRDDIVEGQLKPGERLRIDHMKARYDVSAGTIREAITRLVSDALVEAEGQRGFRVTALSMADLRDLTELRLHLELQALRVSIRRRDATWREGLQLAFDQLTGEEQPVKPDRRKRWELLNTRFHEALIAGCDSPRTLRILRQLAREGERYRRFTLDMSGAANRHVHIEHQLIFESAMDGLEARAALALEAHIRATSDMLERAFVDRPDLFERERVDAAAEAFLSPTT
jgi:DNA-binding GntR family transcriptional regulator